MRWSSVALALAAVGCGEPGQDTSNDGTTVEPADIAPGSRTVPRLTAMEYDLTVRDLLGTSDKPGRKFPPDEVTHGFDNVASALVTTVTHVELWEAATDDLLDEMFGRVIEETESFKIQAEGTAVSYLGDGEPYEDSAYQLYDGSVVAALSLPYDGHFVVSIGASGETVSLVPPKMSIQVDGVTVATVDVLNASGNTVKYAVEVDLDVGLHTFAAVMTNPGSNGSVKRTLVVDYLQVTGPTEPETGRTAAYNQHVQCAPDGLPDRVCAEQAIVSFGRAAWRRPLAAEDVTWALGAYDEAVAEGQDGGEALQYAFKNIMLAPEFLYRLEQDPGADEAYRALDGYEIATRLAAFLWASTPDSSLLDLAGSGALTDPVVLEDQVERMISDPRGAALVDNLAEQWFIVRQLDYATPNADIYPSFDTDLRASMQEELRLRLQEFFREGAPLDDLLLSQTTWVDARLAEEYGLPYTGAGEFVRTPTVGFDRFGLFGSAGWLLANSRVDGPSAVKRGEWILENLLCSPPPPPPPNVEGSVTLVPEDGSVRAQEEAQRGDDFCQSCHAQMDPLGFALHKFDGIGMKRTVDEFGFPIDDVSVFNGATVDGPRGLAELVVADPRLTTCVVEKTFTYALGREVTLDDGSMIESIEADFMANGQTFGALAKAIVMSDAFRLRGAPEVE